MIWLFMAATLLVPAGVSAGQAQKRPAGTELASLVPRIGTWEEKERASYFPDDLFEYIDGASESYISYDFKELLLVQFSKAGTGGAGTGDITLTLEIYDMGTPLNAFGIYGAERYPENTAAEVGDSGYAENESLNFITGRFYVKIISFGLGDEAPAEALRFGREIASAVREKGRLPWVLSMFPKENLVAQSEKYVKNNFMGHAFLHDGFTASYKMGGQEAEAFIAAASSEKDAEAMLNGLLEFNLREKLIPAKMASGYHIKNRYNQHLYIERVGVYVCGVTRVPDGMETEGEKLAGAVAEALARRAAGAAAAKISGGATVAKRGTAS